MIVYTHYMSCVDSLTNRCKLVYHHATNYWSTVEPWVVRFGNSIVVRKGPSIVQAVLEVGVEETC